MAQNIQTMELKFDEKTMEHIRKLKQLMGAEDISDVFRRSLAIADALQTLESEKYEIIAKSSHEGVTDKRLEITHSPKFGIRLVTSGR
jgi:hypothetical protein